MPGLLALLLLSTPAWAQDPAEAVAARAQAVHEAHCADVAVADDSGAAQAIGEVSAVWVDVADVHQETGATWLLYWRGLLAQCIGQEERAREALTEFLASDAGDEGMGAMVGDARLRLKRMDGASPVRSASAPLSPERSGRIVAGLSFGIGAGGAAAGSAAGLVQHSTTAAQLTSNLWSTDEADTLIATGDGQLAASIGLIGGAVAATVGSVAAFVASGEDTVPPVAVIVSPRHGGAMVALGGRW